MTSNRKRTPRIVHKLDHDGAPVVLVEMSNRPGRFATLDLHDWEEWSATRSARLFLNDNGHGHYYVRATSDAVKGSLVSVARELVSPGRGRIVGYRDENRFNLRRRNLFVQWGYAKGQTLVAAA